MRIQKIRVEGFRLLQDVEILLEPASTVIVGRNNSGKTSLTDVFDRFTSEGGSRFRLEDFSAENREQFWNAKEMRRQDANAEDVMKALPKIAITLSFAYELHATDLGPLAPFIIDLDVSSTTVTAKIEYAPNLSTLHMLLDIPAVVGDVPPRHHFFRCLKETLPKSYSIRVMALDPSDANNQRHFEGTSTLAALLQCNFVRAQRTLDHATYGDSNVIGKLLSTLFRTAKTPNAADSDQELAARLKHSVEDIERSVQNGFDEMLKGLFPAMDVLGFPSLNDTVLRPETSLNVEALLSDHTRVVYAGGDGVHLPEGYNGLGTRNLIYMLLQLESYHKIYRAKATRPVTHLIFIEEPEAHLHPQMQEVFINQLNAAIAKLSQKYPNEPTWKVQFVITTHSSHVANAAPFEAVRYFLNDPPTASARRKTKVKDFKKGMATISPEDQDFLHQYMTLTKCDLYFADKAILVEGTTERLLIPRLCGSVDKLLPESSGLARQYVTSVEVGGAYAHIFYPLLDFLELKTLVITDLDSVHEVDETDKNQNKIKVWKKCPVSIGKRTSNTAIREWFRPKGSEELPNISLSELAAKTDADKLNGYRRLAYQIPENEHDTVCARSYEDALILANPTRFNLKTGTDDTKAWLIAKGLPKAETALRFAIKEKDWTVPRYIREGLIWLSKPAPPPAEPPALSEPEQAIQNTAGA